MKIIKLEFGISIEIPKFVAGINYMRERFELLPMLIVNFRNLSSEMPQRGFSKRLKTRI